MEETPKKPAPGKTDFSKLVDLMESNNKSTTQIEVDGRNARRHLLEMKSMQKVMTDFQARTLFGFENFQDMIDSQSLQGMEDSSERMGIFQEIRDALRNLPQETATATKDEKSGGGGLIGGKIAGVLAGVGAAALGVGVGIAAVMSQMPKLVEAFENADMEKIKNNILVLTSINDELGGKTEAMKDGGALFVVLTAIGTGLAVFAIGGTAAAAADKFGKGDWAQKIVDNVTTLLSIADLPTDDGQIKTTFKALAAIGSGLVLFGVGSFFAMAASDKTAEEVKAAVGTYLSIGNLEGASVENAELVGKTLKKLGTGLAAFGIGSFFANAASATQAAEVRDSVEKLLEINDIEGANPTEGKKVSDTLASLKKGLMAFGVGSFFAKAVGESMGANVKSQVIDLLSIGKEVDPKDTTIATEALNSLGSGLNKFAQGSFATSVSDFYGGIMDFFSGSDGPVAQAIKVGKNAEKITKGANAFNSFVDSVDSLSKLGRIDLDLDDTVDAMVDYTRVFDKIIDGGKIKAFGPNFHTEGLAALQSDMDNHVSSIVRLRDALVMDTGGVTMSSPSPNEGEQLSADSIKLMNSLFGREVFGNNTTIAQRGGDTVKGGDTILITNNTNQVTDSLHTDR